MNIYFDDPYYFAKVIATVVIAAQIAGILVFLWMIFRPKDRLIQWIGHRSIGLALIVAIVAVSSSLTFSDYFHMEPCKLCWYQRIVIFPQVLILLIAFLRKYRNEVVWYSSALACVAIPISIFHYLLQMIDAPALHGFAPCDVTGQAPSCSSYYVILYGYVTIPMMALTTSLLILLLMVLHRRTE